MALTSSTVGGDACFLKRLLNPNTGKHSLTHNMRKMEARRKPACKRRMLMSYREEDEGMSRLIPFKDDWIDPSGVLVDYWHQQGFWDSGLLHVIEHCFGFLKQDKAWDEFLSWLPSGSLGSAVIRSIPMVLRRSSPVGGNILYSFNPRIRLVVLRRIIAWNDYSQWNDSFIEVTGMHMKEDAEGAFFPGILPSALGLKCTQSTMVVSGTGNFLRQRGHCKSYTRAPQLHASRKPFSFQATAQELLRNLNNRILRPFHYCN